MLGKIDGYLFVAAMRAAHWADYRWHINNYRIARWLSLFAAFGVVGSGLDLLIPLPKTQFWIYPVILLLNVSIAYIYMSRAERYQTASDNYERAPEKISFPREAIVAYMIGPWIRLSAAVMALVLAVFVCRLWLLFGDCIAIYFIMIPPSHRKRKEKKARDWSFGLTLQPIGGRNV